LRLFRLFRAGRLAFAALNLTLFPVPPFPNLGFSGSMAAGSFARILLAGDEPLTDLDQPEKSNEQPLEQAGAAPAPMAGIQRKNVIAWAVISFAIPASIAFFLHHRLEPDTSVLTLRGELPLKMVLAFFVALGTWVVARMEGRPLAAYGVPPREAFGARFWEGCVWGFAMLSAVLLIIRLTGHFEIDSVALSGAAIFKYALGWGVVFYAVAISEEFIFRCYLLFLYTRRMSFWFASLILSCLFGVAHLGNPHENAFGILQVVVVGMIFCLTIRRTGTLWLAVGFHTTWDWAQTFFYGTPDSGLLGVGRFLNSASVGPNWLTGGSAGPEGSVVAFIVLLLFALLVHLRFPTARYLDGQQQSAQNIEK
jgi:uncharacterized protein